jgi:FtsP/CotA-like multicopper oxidase with cupredoxin domain
MGRVVLNRRAFLGMAAASGVVLATGSAVTTATRVSAPSTATRNPLYIPPVVDVGGLQTPYSLTEAPATVDLGGGKLSQAWVYNGLLPGPTFRARPGNTARFTLHNGLTEPTITHWHGMVVDHLNDGHPIYAIAPGGMYSYAFPVNQRAALNWYHPHPDGLTGEQVALGLAGAFIINDAQEDGLGLPSGSHEAPLVIRDAVLDSTGNLKYTPKGGGFLGSIPLVNGTRDPYLSVDTALYRFRVLGGANARIFGLALSNGAPFWLIGNDGGLLTAPVNIAQLDLAPGERLDLLVDFRGMSVGQTVMLRDVSAGWDLLEFRVTQQVTDTTTVPASLSTIAPLASPVRTRTFSFDGMSKINGLLYDVNRIDFQVPFGDVERWRFITSGNAPHPVHVHGASFQVVSRTGGRGQIFPWEHGWKDTVLLNDFETVDVLIQFSAYRGEYLLHCHKLEHEDSGMMSNFEVI